MRRSALARGSVVLFLLVLSPLVHLFAQQTPATVTGADLVLQDNVVDLRTNAQMRQVAAGSVGGYASVANLQVGSIFISPDNAARRVVGIQTQGNTTIIQTDTPPIQDVVASYYMPDQSITLSQLNIVPGSVQPGVTILSTPSTSVSANISRSLVQGPTWMGTDTNPAVQGGKVIRVSFDIPIKTNKQKKSKVPCTYGCLQAGVNGQVRLQGTLSIIDPQISAGMLAPSIHVKWVTQHLFGLINITIPEFSIEPGYIHTSFNSAEQLDAHLTGTENLQMTYMNPLLQLEAGTGSTKVGVTVYLKVTANGQVSVDFSADEYARLGLWGTSDLAWPFIPENVRAGSSFYYNFAGKPSLSATAKLKFGPDIQSNFDILGIPIMNSDTWGGLYSNASGRLTANDIIGLDENIGAYGSTAAFTYAGSIEVGGFLTMGVNLASMNMSLIDRTWPFVQLSASGGGP